MCEVNRLSHASNKVVVSTVFAKYYWYQCLVKWQKLHVKHVYPLYIGLWYR